MPALEPREAVGQLLRRLRDEKGLTQGQVVASANARAEAAGSETRVTREWLSFVENGRIQRPDRERLECVAQALRVQPELLVAAAGYRIEPVPIAREPTPEEMLEEVLVRLRQRRATEDEIRNGLLDLLRREPEAEGLLDELGRPPTLDELIGFVKIGLESAQAARKRQ